MNSHRVHTALAAGTFLTFGIASAVAVGAIPVGHQGTPVIAANVAAPRHLISRSTTSHVRVTRAHHGVAVTTKKVAAKTIHHTVVPAAVPAVGPASTAATPNAAATHASHAQQTRRHRPAAVTTPKKPAKPRITKPRLAPRTTPSASAVQAAIQGLKQYVHSILSPTPSQVAQFGDMVCSAYDAGDSTAKIENQILQKVSGLPFTTVLPGAAGYVVRTAVSLYCPGYTSRLGSAAA